MKVMLRNPTRTVEVDGVRSVLALLQKLAINPESVLVIRGGELLTRDAPLEPDDEVEVRNVISGGQAGPRPRAKCKRCGEQASVDVPSANAAFCGPCFLEYVRRKVTRAVEDHEMLKPGDKVLVAVSGGKDSLALWDILLDLGYDATGYHLVLWTGEDYASESRVMCERFAEQRGAPLIVRDLRMDDGYTIEQVAREGRRVPCSVCGLTKRHLLSRAAHEGGFDVLATGHNLDDEAATLFGNVLHWSTEYMARQKPVLPSSHDKFVRKVKPFYRVAERESAAYAILQGIDYIVEECPLVAGNTQLRYKEALNLLEQRSPGTKQQFVLGFHDRAAALFDEADEKPELRDCGECGMPTPGEICAYCRMVRTLRSGEGRPRPHRRRRRRAGAATTTPGPGEAAAAP